MTRLQIMHVDYKVSRHIAIITMVKNISGTIFCDISLQPSAPHISSLPPLVHTPGKHTYRLTVCIKMLMFFAGGKRSQSSYRGLRSQVETSLEQRFNCQSPNFVMHSFSSRRLLCTSEPISNICFVISELLVFNKSSEFRQSYKRPYKATPKVHSN